MNPFIDKHRKTLAQMAQYFVVAAVGLGVDFGMVIFCTEVLNWYYLVGICAGFLLGLVITYFLSNKFVFGSPKGNHRRAFVLFGIIGLIGLGILNLLVWALTSGLGINYILSKALATIVIFLWNFFARKKLFREKQDYLEA
jgi:putative flippase GtrA